MKINILCEQTISSYLWDGVCSIFSGAGKFRHTNGLRQANSDDSTLSSISDVTFAPPRQAPNDVRKMSLCGVKCKNCKK